MDIAVATRPVRPDDVALFGRLWPRLSPETVYRRFHAPLHRPPGRGRHAAWSPSTTTSARPSWRSSAARSSASPATTAPPPTPSTAEFAIVVEDAWQGVGVGRQLLVELIELAAAPRRAHAHRHRAARQRPRHRADPAPAARLHLHARRRRLHRREPGLPDAVPRARGSPLMNPERNRHDQPAHRSRPASLDPRPPPRGARTAAGLRDRPHVGVRARDRRARRPPLTARQAGVSASSEQANRNAGGTFSGEIRRRTDGNSRRSSDWISGEYWITSATPRGASARGQRLEDAATQPGLQRGERQGADQDVGQLAVQVLLQVLRRVGTRPAAAGRRTAPRAARRGSASISSAISRASGPIRARISPVCDAGARAQLDDEAGAGHVAEVEHVPHGLPRGRQDRAHLPRVGGEGAQEAQPIGQLLVHAAFRGPWSGRVPDSRRAR